MRLRNFRGVVDQTVEFADGVTVVEGPNEAGKSSLAEALDLLRTTKATASSKAIRAVRPVHRDADPDVEVELTTGPYQLTFHKIWNRKGTTELTVSAPTPEQLTGEEAHSRFVQILEETVDTDLLQALSVVQGESLQQPVLARVSALHQALGQDAAAVDPGQDALLERIEQEYLTHFTPKGRPTGTYAKAIERLDAARQEVARAAQASENLDLLVEERGRTQAALQDAERRFADATERSAQLEGAARQLQQLQDLEAERARAVADAERTLAQAQAALKERQELTDAVSQATAAADASVAKATHTAGALERAERAQEEAEEKLGRAREDRRQQEAAEQKAAAALEAARAGRELVQLRTRVERAKRAADELQKAQDALKSWRVTPDDAARVEQLEVDLRLAERARAAVSARVTVRALGEEAVEVDGRVLAAGEQHEGAVLSEVRVTVPGVAEVLVEPGTPPQELEDASGAARAALDEALEQLAVSSAAQARTAAGERSAAQARAQAARGDLDYVLDGAQLEQLVSRMAELEQRAATDGTADPAPAADIGLLEEALATCQRDASRARDAERAQQAALEAARAARADADREAATAAVRAEHAQAAAQTARDSLARAAAAADREQLAAAEVAAGEAHRAAVAALDLVRAQLEAIDPETLTMEVDNATDLVASTRRQVDELSQQLVGQDAVLRREVELGIYDQLADAQAELDAAESAARRLERAAAAARLLREAVLRHRDAAQLKYVAPFQERIERLGRVVFGPDFAVEVSPELEIVSRTLQGRIVPFAYLSAGAREQLALLGRLACAQTVDTGDGAPVILDDALGFSDPERLRTLGVVLHDVGRTAQVVVLTCQPDRFAGLGGARVVRL